MTPQALLSELDRLQGDEHTLSLSEAWLYIGQRHMADGPVNAARDAFEKCRALSIASYCEHVAAGFELVRVGKR